MVSIGGNLYSVPDCTRRRIVEVHTLANEIPILEDDKLIAVHPVLGRGGQRRIAGGHRSAPPPGNSRTVREMPPATALAGAVPLHAVLPVMGVGRERRPADAKHHRSGAPALGRVENAAGPRSSRSHDAPA
jgi:hypothetical protein